MELTLGKLDIDPYLRCQKNIYVPIFNCKLVELWHRYIIDKKDLKKKDSSLHFPPCNSPLDISRPLRAGSTKLPQAKQLQHLGKKLNYTNNQKQRQTNEEKKQEKSFNTNTK